jgi:glycerol-3-phosphate cytidylyltransferase
MSKIKSISELSGIVSAIRKSGKKVVFTNGCFDIIHVGHIRYLAQAKEYGDVLIVGLNSDESVKALKGTGHPIQAECERAEILAALESVDYIVIFHERVPDVLIKEIRPDIHVKGGDYKLEQIPESKLVQSLGGTTVIADKIEGFSTSNIIKKIKEL